MPVTSDVAWQLPLARLLKAKNPSARSRTPAGSVLPNTSYGQDMLLGASNADQMLQNACGSDEELAFSYAFADLKHGDVICNDSHAQVKEVRMSEPDTCREPFNISMSMSCFYHCRRKVLAWCELHSVWLD